jgi:hypothetical protein
VAGRDDKESLTRAYGAVVDAARAEVAAGREPDARALEERVRAVRRGVRGYARGEVDRAERAALQQLERVLAVHRARVRMAHAGTPAPARAASPPRRAAFRSRPTISGNMEVRRNGGDPPTLTWDAAPVVAEWEVRVSERSDPRGDYAVRETLTLPGATTSVEIPLGDVPLRVHLLGRNRAGRLVQRALISALTRETWGDRWQRRASAS